MSTEFSFAQIFQLIGESIGGFLPFLLAALAVLLGGWIVAKILSTVIRRGLRRLRLGERLNRWTGGADGAIDIEGGIARIVFWIIMVLALVGFFQVLGISVVTEPLNQFLNQIFAFTPQLLGAAILLLIAWIVASIARVLVRRGLEASRFEERLLDRGEVTDESATPISATVSDAAYWLTLLLFLPAVIGALHLEGLLGPVQGMIDNVLTFLPNVLAAVLILIIGWLVARIVRRVTASFLASVGVDRLGERVGLGASVGTQRLSELLGLTLYVLILIPVLIGALNALQLDAVTAPTSNMLDAILGAVPNIFAAALVVGIAFVVGRLVAGLVERLLAGAGFDRVLVWLGIGSDQATVAWTPSRIVSTLVVVAVMLFAAIEGSRLLGFSELAALISQFTVFGAQILFGLVIFALGLFLASLAARALSGSGVGNATLLAIVARSSILVLAGAMALLQMGIADEVVLIAFGLTGGAVAVAAAIAFGIGGREAAGRLVDEWLQRFRQHGD